MTLTNDNISVRNNCMQLSGNFCLKIALKIVYWVAICSY